MRNLVMADLVTLSHYEPAARYYHTSQRVGQKILVHGGWTKPEISDQSKLYLQTLVEVFDPYSELWEQRQVGGQAPRAGTYASVCASVNESLYTFGGLNSSNQEINSLYQLDTKQWHWHRLPCLHGSDTPMPKYGCGMVAFGSERLGVFGGYGTPRGHDLPGEFVRDSSLYSGSYSGTYSDSRGWTNEFHEYHLEKGTYARVCVIKIEEQVHA